MKKVFAVILTLCMAMTVLTGCGGPKGEPADSVKAIYDLYIAGDTKGVSKLGLTDEDIKTALDSYDKALLTTIRGNFTAAGVTVEEDKLNEIVEARKAALAKMTAEYEQVSKDKKKAVIKIKTTYFDEAALDTQAATDAASAAEASGITEYEDYMKFVMDTYTQNIIDAYNAVTPSSDKKEITVNCTITDNTWLPEDMSGFGTDLGLAVSGQK